MSDFEFGMQEASPQDQTYYAGLMKIQPENGTSKEVNNFVQVTDLSGGKNGWKLYVKFETPLINERNHTIKGVHLKLMNLEAVSNSEIASKPVVEAKEIDVSAENNDPTLVYSAFNAAGTWSIIFGKNPDEGKKSVGLLVPGNSEKEQGTYQTSLIWTLTSEL